MSRREKTQEIKDISEGKYDHLIEEQRSNTAEKKKKSKQPAAAPSTRRSTRSATRASEVPSVTADPVEDRSSVIESVSSSARLLWVSRLTTPKRLLLMIRPTWSQNLPLMKRKIRRSRRDLVRSPTLRAGDKTYAIRRDDRA